MYTSASNLYCAHHACYVEEEGERQDECMGVSEVCLPPQERKRGGRSRKAKKKIRNVVRMAEVYSISIYKKIANYIP